MRVRTFFKLRYLQANFGQGLPEKVLNDEFFFTISDDLLPALQRFRPDSKISSGKRKAIERDRNPSDMDNKDGKVKIRTVSGTNLGDIRIDAISKHIYPSMNPLGK